MACGALCAATGHAGASEGTSKAGYGNRPHGGGRAVRRPVWRVRLARSPSSNRRVGALNAKGVNGKGIPSGAVFVEVSFAKVLYDVKTDLSSIAKTWWTFAYGMHNGDASSLMHLLV